MAERVNPEWVEAGARALNAEGGAPGSSLHSWRCEDKERYPEDCTCVAETVVEILAAVEPLIRADERERVWSGYVSPASAALIGRQRSALIHAEAVAARLVEVICEQESLIVWNIRWREQAEADRAHLRAQIAAEIEAAGPRLPCDFDECDFDEGVRRAARIARGES